MNVELKSSLEWLNSLVKIYDLAVLEKYFIYKWRCPISYYNPYSSLLYAGKVKLANKLPLNTYSCFLLSPCQTLLLQVGEAEPIFHLIAPKDELASYLICKRLKNLTKYSIILHVPDFEPDVSNYVVSKDYEQVVYDCRFLIESIDKDLSTGSCLILNSRSRTTLKKNLLECSYRRVISTNEDEEAIKKVIQYWAECAAAKDKKYHLFKDYYSMPWALNNFSDNLLAFLGYRKEYPASYSLLTVLPAYPHIAAQLITKSLNYKKVPGGYNETAVWELYNCSRQCVEKGVSHINASDIGPLGLKMFKERFKGETKNIRCRDWKII